MKELGNLKIDMMIIFIVNISIKNNFKKTNRNGDVFKLKQRIELRVAYNSTKALADPHRQDS